MLVSETITTIALIAVGLFTIASLYIGLLGMLGAISIGRCAMCGHVSMSLTGQPAHQCRRCRHRAHIYGIPPALSTMHR
jgi:hypothetical protein